MNYSYPLCVLKIKGKNAECYHDNKEFFGFYENTKKSAISPVNIECIIETMENPDFTAKEIDSAVVGYVLSRI